MRALVFFFCLCVLFGCAANERAASIIYPSRTPRAGKNPTVVNASPTARDASPTAQTPVPNFISQIDEFVSPDGAWVARVDWRAGMLALEKWSGEAQLLFPAGSGIQSTIWSPRSDALYVVRAHIQEFADASIAQRAPIQLWQISFANGTPGEQRLMFVSNASANTNGYYDPEHIVFLKWSPDARWLLIESGIASASMLADGQTLYALDTRAGENFLLTDAALFNPRYSDWAPDSSALVFSAGSYRSAQINKWLAYFDARVGVTKTLIPKTELIPGNVAWSPRGDWIAFAAVRASETGDEWADWMRFENRAIRARRIYLLDPKTAKYRRLNDANAFQDAPVWSEDGSILYYVQHDGDAMQLMSADPRTGRAEKIPNARIPTP